MCGSMQPFPSQNMFRSLVKPDSSKMSDFCQIRQYLKVAVIAADVLVISCHYYCNSLFRVLSCFNQHKHSIQNTFAHIATNQVCSCHTHPTATPLAACQLLFHVHKHNIGLHFLCSGSPSYLGTIQDPKQLLLWYLAQSPRLSFPVSSSFPHVTLQHFGHSLAFAVPEIWNDRHTLPVTPVQLCLSVC